MSGRALLRNGVRILEDDEDLDDEEVEAPAKPAATYEIPQRLITALEHPMIIQNLDNGLKTLGRNNPFAKVGLKSTFTQKLRSRGLLSSGHFDIRCIALSGNKLTGNRFLSQRIPKIVFHYS